MCGLNGSRSRKREQTQVAKELGARVLAFGRANFRISVAEDGLAGPREEVASLPGALPDGLALDAAGNLYVACYEPSQVLRVAPDGTVECLIRDHEAHLLCHPTNLGPWHITAIGTTAEGLPLYGGYGVRQ
jgi:hypothetical protein